MAGAAALAELYTAGDLGGTEQLEWMFTPALAFAEFAAALRQAVVSVDTSQQSFAWRRGPESSSPPRFGSLGPNGGATSDGVTIGIMLSLPETCGGEAHRPPEVSPASGSLAQFLRENALTLLRLIA